MRLSLSVSAVSEIVVALIVYTSVSTSFAHGAPHPEAAVDQRPTYAVTGKVSEPRLFAEGIISTVDDEIGGSFSPDGSDFYFTKLGNHLA